MKRYITLLILAVLSFSSCKKYLDINYDPNSVSADQAENDMVLPSAEMAICSQYGNFMRIIGGYLSEHYCQIFGTSNYLDFSQFTVSSTRTNTLYTYMMMGIANATVVRDKAETEEDWGTYLAATTLRVFAYQALVDAYGEISYTEGMDASNLNPSMDDGDVVYAGLVSELDDALSKATSTSLVATNFLYSGSSADPWIKFANALKLKILMRESGVANVQSALDALVSEGNFPTADVAWAGIWSDATGKANPFYQEEFATYFGSTQVNVGLNVALYTTMDDYDDPRLDAFFSKNSSDAYWGGLSGSNLSTANGISSSVYCRPAMTYDSPVYLITMSEIYFFLSEYYYDKGNSAQASSYYALAIEASFDSAGASGSSTAISAYPFSMKNLAIQKWVALSGTNNYEAWCEMRRLGYPEFGSVTASDMYNATSGDYDPSALEPACLYTPLNYDTQVGENSISQRWPYPTSVLTYNKNAPSTVVAPSVKVFWAE